MTIAVPFEDVKQLETVFHAAVLFKFSGTEDSAMYLGSPIMAKALAHMLTAIQSGCLASGQAHRAREWKDLYTFGNASRHIDLVSEYARKHPSWSTMSVTSKIEWLRVLASPYLIDDLSGQELVDQIDS